MDFKSTFDANPGVEVLYGFEDGNAFVKQSEADAYKKRSGNDYTEIRNADSVKMDSAEFQDETENHEETELKENHNKHNKRK